MGQLLDDMDLSFWTNRCRHQDARAKACLAGVRYADLVPEQTGRLLRLPCFITARSNDVVPCERLSRYSREEAIAECDEMERAFTAYEAGKSPCCGGDLTRRPGGNSASCGKCGKLVAHECRAGGDLP